MTEWKGKVAEKTYKDWNTVRLYKFKIEGNDRWFSTGKEQIPQEVGEEIAFQEKNGKVIAKTTAIPTTLKEATSEPASTVMSPTQDSTSKIGSRIQHQAARADATRLVCAALQTDHLPHNANTAKGKRLDLLLGYVKEITNQFIEEENESA